MRFGVIGCGGISRWHVEGVRAIEGASLTCVCDASEERARAAGESYGVPWFTGPSGLIGSGLADAVCICTPSGLHAGAVIEALNAGLHVVAEKPLAITPESLAAVLEAEEKSAGRLMVISQLRFAEDVLAVRSLLGEGALGRITLVDLSMKYYREPAYFDNGWRGTKAMDGGGALMNQGIHGADVLRWLCGPVKRVSCQTGTLLHGVEVEDTLAARLEFAHGGLGVITASTSCRPGQSRRLEIGGTRGSVTLVEREITFLSVDGETRIDRAPSKASAGQSDPFALSFEPHKKQFRAFADSLRRGEKPMPDGREAAATLELIFALYRSAEAGGAEEVF